MYMCSYQYGDLDILAGLLVGSIKGEKTTVDLVSIKEQSPRATLLNYLINV